MRTTVELVKKILDDTELEDPVIESYIDGANIFVDANLSGKGLGTALLAEIERWIAAHMIVSTRERMAAVEGAGGAEITYTGKWGEGLAGTPYGQNAVILDTTGTLLAMTQGKLIARVRAVTSFK